MENKWKLGVVVPKIRVRFLPNNEDYSIWGSIFGSPYFLFVEISLYPRFVQVRHIMLGHAYLQDGFL